MEYLMVKNWGKFQHYRDRTPPWIKLYTDLLSDYEYTCLQDDSRLLLIMIYLIASQTENKIPYDEKWIQQKAMLRNGVDLKPLINAGFLISYHNDSDSLSNGVQNACLEERRGEKRREEETAKLNFKFEKAVALPKDIFLTEQMRKYAHTKGMDDSLTEDQFEAFCIRHRQKGSKFSDWYAAWQMWVRKHFEFHPDQKKNIKKQLMECTECTYQTTRKEMEAEKLICPMCGHKVEWKPIPG